MLPYLRVISLNQEIHRAQFRSSSLADVGFSALSPHNVSKISETVALHRDSAFFVIDVAAIISFPVCIVHVMSADSPYQRSHDSR